MKQIQNNTRTLTFGSVSEMRAFAGGTGLEDDEPIYLNSDSLSGWFYWDENSTATDDGEDVVKITTVTTGRFLRRDDYNQGGTGSVDRTKNSKLQESVSVKDFGAVGDGVTDDSSAIQAAVDFANYGERSVLIPAGEYYTGTTSIIVNGPIRIYGEGMGQAYGDSFGALCTTIRYVGSDAAIKVNTGISKSTLGFVLEDFAVSGYATGTATATGSYGIRYGADTGSNLSCQGEVRNVRHEGFTVAGAHFLNAQGVESYNCRYQFNTGVGILQEGGATAGGGNRSNGFTHCLSKQNTKGCFLKEGGNTRFVLTHFEQNDEEGVHIQRQASSGDYSFNDFYFDRCHIENNQLSPNTGDAWVTSTAYVRGDFVNESSLLYKCVTAHTSGTFATDLAAGNWVLVEYAAQFLVDTALDTGAGGARVFASGGRWIAKPSETNGIRKNRLWEVNHGTFVKEHCRPNLFSYPEGSVEAIEDNSSSVIRVVDNFSPWTTAGSPTTQRPVDATDFWTLPSSADLSAKSSSLSYEHVNVGDGNRYWATDEDVYRVSAFNAQNTFEGGFRSRSNAAAVTFEVNASGNVLTNQTAANTNTPSGATARQFPVYNENGTLMGYIPVYGSAW